MPYPIEQLYRELAFLGKETGFGYEEMMSMDNVERMKMVEAISEMNRAASREVDNQLERAKRRQR